MSNSRYKIQYDNPSLESIYKNFINKKKINEEFIKLNTEMEELEKIKSDTKRKLKEIKIEKANMELKLNEINELTSFQQYLFSKLKENNFTDDEINNFLQNYDKIFSFDNSLLEKYNFIKDNENNKVIKYFLNNREFVYNLILNFRNSKKDINNKIDFWDFFKFVSDELKKDKDFLIGLIKEFGRFIEFAHPEIKDDIDIIIETIIFHEGFAFSSGYIKIEFDLVKKIYQKLKIYFPYTEVELNDEEIRSDIENEILNLVIGNNNIERHPSVWKTEISN
jgi:hypothetical protein